MDHPKIILLGCFYNLFPGKILTLDEPLYHLYQLKFDGEDGISITEHISNFLKFCEYYKIDDEYFACVTFFITL